MIDADRQRTQTERTLLWSIIALALVRLASLPLYPVLDRSEARYATVAMWMVEKGDWITPTIDGRAPFWGKPPLAFWLTAFSYRMFGLNELAARLPSLLIYLAIVWLVFLLGREVRDRMFGLLSACLFASMGLAFFLSGSVMTDPALALGITASMVAFWIAMTRDSRVAGYAVFVAFGIALLAKGPIGVLLPAAALFVWSIWEGRLREAFRRLPILSGSLVTLAIALPWYLLAEHNTPGFLNYFIVGEHFQRYLDPGWKGDLYGTGRKTPLGMIWLFALVATLPWSAVAIGSALRRRVGVASDRSYLRQSWFRFLLAWSLVPLVFFSLARNTIITYALPSMPPLALLMAHLLQRLRWNRRPRLLIAGVAVAPTLLLLGVGVGLLFPSANLLPSQAGLVALWNSAEHPSDEPLVYLIDKPYSADFYTRGRMATASSDEAIELLRTGKIHALAVVVTRLNDVPGSLRANLTELGRRDRSALFVAKPNHHVTE